MKKPITIFIFLIIQNFAFSQSNQDLIGTWKFQSVTTTNPNCKEVDYFPINTFKFSENGKAEFNSGEGIAKSSYRLNNKIIELFDLSENGVKQDGSAEFLIKNLNNTTLTLLVEYECGSIDIIFKK